MSQYLVTTLAVVWIMSGATAFAADPYDAVVPLAAEASTCFRVQYEAPHLAAHRDQRTTEVMLSLLRVKPTDREFEMRLRFVQIGHAKPLNVVGYCSHYAVDATAPPPSVAERNRVDRSLSCLARGGLGGSAEEGGEFELEIAPDRKAIMVRTEYGFSAWEGDEQTAPPIFVRLGEQDLTFRLKTVDSGLCADVERKISVE